MYQYAMEEFADRDELLTWFLRVGWTEWEALAIEPTSDTGYRVWLRRRPGKISRVTRSADMRRRAQEHDVSHLS
jgi:hypothetical protein